MMLKRIIHKLHVLIEQLDHSDASVSSVQSELQMILPESCISSPPVWNIPEGFSLRTYRPGDEVQYFSLMERAGFPGWNLIEFHKYLQKLLPEGFFFLIKKDNGGISASAMALHNPHRLHPFGGSLSCVAVEPQCRGMGLGYVISAVATCRLISAGFKDIYLETDDWRLPAIKIYLKMGWVPFIYQEDMFDRWKAVCRALDWDFTPENWKVLINKVNA